jgi:PAS domain S-box-containing protein
MATNLADRWVADGTSLCVVPVGDGSWTDPFVSRLADRQQFGSVEMAQLDDVGSLVADSDTNGVVFLRPSGNSDPAQSHSSDLTRLVDSLDVSCPVIVAGKCDDADAARLYEAGVTDLIPVAPDRHPETLATQITTVVERYHETKLSAELFDESTTGVVVHDPESGEIRTCNKQFREMLGYDEAYDITLSDISGHEDGFTRERAVSLVQAAARGETQTFEWRDPTADGEEIWVEVTLQRKRVVGEPYVVASVRDVTDRKDQETELQATRNRLDRMFGRISDAFFALDEDWTVSYVNEAGAAVLNGAMGRDDDPSELLGLHLWEEIPEAVDTTFYEKYHEAMRTQEPVTFEAEYEPMGVCFEVRAYPDEDGLSVYFHDVTERKRREREMERFGEILESLDDAVYAVDSDGEIAYVNERYAEMKKVPREELIGTNIYDWVDEEMAERAGKARERVKSGEEGVAQLEYDFLTSDGERFPAELRFTTVRQEGSDLGRVGVIRDLSERKERERELYIKERAMEKASLPITLTDPSEPENPLSYVNEAFEELTGYDAEEALGRNCRFLQGPHTDRETVAEIRRKIRDEETIRTEIRNYRKDRTPFWNQLEISPIYDRDGSLLRYLGTQTDVTEKRRVRSARKQLLSTTRELLSAETPEEIARIVSHAAETVLNHEYNIVYLDEEESDEPEPTAWSESVERVLGAVPEARADGVASEAIETGEPQIYDNLSAVTDRSSEEYEPIESLLVLPLADRGAVVLGETSKGAFDESDLDLGQLLTVNAAVAFERTDRIQELLEYETLFETVQDQLYVLDAEGYFQLVSEPLASALGYDRAELEGKHASEITNDSTLEWGEDEIRRQRVDANGVSNSYEGTLVGKDGTEMPVEIELSLLPSEERFRGSVGVVRDISQRRRRERELGVFREAITEAGIGLAMYDAEGRITYANDHYSSLLGESRERTESGVVWERFANLAGEDFRTYWESFAPGETRRTETELTRVDGTTIPVDVSTTAVRIGDEQAHIQTVREITGRRERRQQADALHRIIRHNLRNDLTVVLGHANMLAEKLDEEYAHWAEMIGDTAEELVDLSKTVQDAERIVDRDTVRKPVEVVELLREEIADLRSEFDVHVETDLPRRQYVTADSSLSVALEHLLWNAVEHNDATEPEVEVSVCDVPKRAGWVAIEVSDNGPGIPEYELDVLTAGEETPLNHGSGMGLWVVYWVVSRYGGELDFETDDDGTTARIALPAPDPMSGSDVPQP